MKFKRLKRCRWPTMKNPSARRRKPSLTNRSRYS
jgi:hypothetical protein